MDTNRSPAKYSLTLSLFLAIGPTSYAADAQLFKCRSISGHYTYQNRPCTGDLTPARDWNAPPLNVAYQPTRTNNANAAPATMHIPARPGGGYYARGTVNTVAVEFQIDTGADYISIPREIALRAGLHCTKNLTTQTANGTTTQCEAQGATITFGPFRLERFPVMILPNLASPLLGMNALRHFEMRQREGVLTISR